MYFLEIRATSHLSCRCCHIRNDICCLIDFKYSIITPTLYKTILLPFGNMTTCIFDKSYQKLVLNDRTFNVKIILSSDNGLNKKKLKGSIALLKGNE